MGQVVGQQWEVYGYEKIKNIIPMRGEIVMVTDTPDFGNKLIQLAADGIATVCGLYTEWKECFDGGVWEQLEADIAIGGHVGHILAVSNRQAKIIMVAVDEIVSDQGSPEYIYLSIALPQDMRVIEHNGVLLAAVDYKSYRANYAESVDVMHHTSGYDQSVYLDISKLDPTGELYGELFIINELAVWLPFEEVI